MKRVLSAVIIATLAASTVAAAQEGGPKLRGDLTRVEAKAKALAAFDRLDLNHDGKLDAADRALHRQQAFDRIDTDHNGQISREEFAAAHSHGQGGPGQPGEGHAGDMADRTEGDPSAHRWSHHRGMGHGPMMMHMARMADANHDGAISKDEFVTAALGRFDAEDVNHDGVLTGAERQTAHMAMRDKWRAMHGQGRGDTPPPAPPPAPPAG